MQRLHRVPLKRAPALEVDWRAFLESRRETAVVRHRDGGAPERWLAEIPSFFARVLPTLAVAPRALLSADIHAEHLLVDARGAHPTLTGLLDFGDALVGDPAYEMVTPAVFVVRGRVDVMKALLAGYGIPREARTPELRERLMAYELLHRFGNLARDTRMLAEKAGEHETLDDALGALFPFQ